MRELIVPDHINEWAQTPWAGAEQGLTTEQYIGQVVLGILSAKDKDQEVKTKKS